MSEIYRIAARNPSFRRILHYSEPLSLVDVNRVVIAGLAFKAPSHNHAF